MNRVDQYGALAEEWPFAALVATIALPAGGTHPVGTGLFKFAEWVGMAVQSGGAKFAGLLNAVQAQRLQSASGVQESDSISVYWVAMNEQRKPFDNPMLRQALNYAVDKNARSSACELQHAGGQLIQAGAGQREGRRHRATTSGFGSELARAPA